MALKTDDYMEMGRNHAQNQGPGKLEAPTPYARNNTSWQARAFWKRYDAEVERIKAQNWKDLHVDRKTPIAALRDAEQAHWPQAAREHIRLLVDQSCFCLARLHALPIHKAPEDEKQLKKRFDRLNRSMKRMYKRYGRTSHDFAISTQPHPDGPVTVKQLLREGGRA